MNHTINVLISELRAALLFVSTDESRGAINGVYVESKPGKRPVMVATDGRRLAVIESQAIEFDEEHSVDASFTLSAEFLKPFLNYGKATALTIQIEYHPPKRAIFHFLESCAFLDVEAGAIIDLRYPNFKGAIPKTKGVPCQTLGVSAALIKDFGNAAKLLGAKHEALAVNFFGETGQMEIRIDGKPQFYGVLMPMKDLAPTVWQQDFLKTIQP